MTILRFFFILLCCSTIFPSMYVRHIILLSVCGVQCSKKVRWSLLALEPLMSWSLCHHGSTQFFERFVACFVLYLYYYGVQVEPWLGLLKRTLVTCLLYIWGVDFVARNDYTAPFLSSYRTTGSCIFIPSGLRLHCFWWISLGTNSGASEQSKMSATSLACCQRMWSQLRIRKDIQPVSVCRKSIFRRILCDSSKFWEYSHCLIKALMQIKKVELAFVLQFRQSSSPLLSWLPQTPSSLALSLQTSGSRPSPANPNSLPAAPH